MRDGARIWRLQGQEAALAMQSTLLSRLAPPWGQREAGPGHPTGCLRFHGKQSPPDVYGKCIHSRKFTRYRERPRQPCLCNRGGFRSSRRDSRPSRSKVPHLRTQGQHARPSHTRCMSLPGLWSLRALDPVPGRYEDMAVVPGCRGNDSEGSILRLLNSPKEHSGLAVWGQEPELLQVRRVPWLPAKPVGPWVGPSRFWNPPAAVRRDRTRWVSVLFH